MLTIYNRNKQAIGQLQTSGSNVEVYDVTIYKRANSEYRLSFLLPMNSRKYPLLKEEGMIECEGQRYVIKSIKRNRQGKVRTVEITANHVFNRMMDISIPYSSQIEEALGTHISHLTGLISAATKGVFTFEIMEDFPLKDVYKWGTSNCLKAFQDLVKLYEVEFVPDNYTLKLYKKVNIDRGLQYRYNTNIVSDSFETNTDALVTRMTGYAKDSLTIINLPDSHLTNSERALLSSVDGSIVDGLIKVPYLISQYAAEWATPDNDFFDAEFEETGIDADTEEGKLRLLEEIRKRLAASEIPDIQVKINPADLWKKNARSGRPDLWETVTIHNPDMEMDGLTARVLELKEYPFALDKHGEVTVANYLLKDQFDMIAELNTSKKQLNNLLTNKKVNTSFFEQFAREAVYDINNSKSEIIYDQRGQVLQSKSDANRQVVLTAEGIMITTDAAETAKVALTADGIAAEVVVGLLGDFAYLRANQIVVGAGGELIADDLLAGSAGWNGKTTLLTPEGIYTGKLEANQIKAGLLDVGVIYSGEITTDQLTAGNAKLSTALIENLVVGTNVQMGANATLSWSQVTDKVIDYSTITGSKPASNADNTSANLGSSLGINYTKIGSTYVYTGTLNANQINAGKISADRIETNNLVAERIAKRGSAGNLNDGYLEINGNLADLALYYNGNPYFQVINNITDAAFHATGTRFMRSRGDITFPEGTWDFTGANVQGITAKFG